VVGAIGFIGLVAPHLVRPFVDYAPRRVLLPATLAGALLLLCADIAARLVHTNPELRLGVFTSLLGTPFFFPGWWCAFGGSRHDHAGGGQDQRGSPAARPSCAMSRFRPMPASSSPCWGPMAPASPPC
jgi:hypothetical protein